MTRHARRPRHTPLYTAEVTDDWSVRVYVRPGPLPGSYEVDPGFRADPHGELEIDTRNPRQVPGRRAAIRAAQHRASQHRNPERPARIPADNDPTLPFGIGPWLGLGFAPRTPRTPRPWGTDNTLHRHRNGTYVLIEPMRFLDDLPIRWWVHGYRGRRNAVRGYQAAMQGPARGGYARAYRTDADDEERTA